MSASLNIVADQQITYAVEAFSPYGDLKLVNGRDIDEQLVKDADILLVRSVTPVNARLLDNSSVRFVGSATAGIDHIDLDYLRSRDIEFVHAPGSNARSVAEYVTSCLCILAQSGKFSLSGKSIGIIGVGQVGSRLKKMMEALGLRCILNDPPRAETDEHESWKQLEAIHDADIVSCHVPLTTTGPYPTAELINNDFLQHFKRDVILINTSRGGVVNEAELLQFVENCPEVKLVLDVWCNEPNINQPLLQRADIATAHIAGYSFDGKLKATRQLHDTLASFLQKQNNSVFDKLNVDESSAVTFNNGDDVLYKSVMQSYDASLDSERLKQSLTLPEVRRGQYFDQLRKTYPIRREFRHTVIKQDALPASDRNKLQSIGFTLE